MVGWRKAGKGYTYVVRWFTIFIISLAWLKSESCMLQAVWRHSTVKGCDSMRKCSGCITIIYWNRWDTCITFNALRRDRSCPSLLIKFYSIWFIMKTYFFSTSTSFSLRRLLMSMTKVTHWRRKDGIPKFSCKVDMDFGHLHCLNLH